MQRHRAQGPPPAPARRGRLGIIPENTWDAKAWTHLDRGAGDRPGESGDPGADPDDLAALGLGLGAGGDDRTSAYSRSLEYLSQSAGGGLYRSSGAGVGGFADARGAHGRIRTGDDAARDASSAAGSSSRADRKNLGSSLGPPGSAHASSTRRAGGVVGISLREHVEAELRDKPQESFARYMRDLYGRILRLVNSPDVRRRLGGVYAIDQLTDVKMGENVGKINRFATYLRDVFTPTCEPELAEAASRALGHLVQVGGALTADVVESEVRRSLGWLQAPERVEARRYAAVLILRELAANAPTVFNVHVPAFIDAIWPALRDPRMNVRLAAVRALRECLVVIEKRETRYRVQWYYKLYEETQNGISTKMASVEQTHGSLLAFGEMLRHTGEFMLSRYKEVAETVLRLHDSRERIVRRSVVELIPKLAAFSPRRFAESYLEQSMALLLAAIQTPGERDAGFTAVGDLAAALADDDEDDESNDDESGEGSGRGASGRGGHETGNETGNGGMSSSSGLIRGAGGFAAADKTRDGGVPAFEKYLPEITDAIQETCAARGRAANALGRRGASAAQPESGAFEALLCAGALAQSVGPAWEPHARVLLPSLFAGGLSAPLVEALEAMATALPATLPQIQRRLIDAISAVLNPGAPPGLGARLRAGGGLGGAGAYSQGAHLQSNHGVAGHGGGHGGALIANRRAIDTPSLGRHGSASASAAPAASPWMIALDVLGFSEFSGERLEHGRDVREHQSRARAHERGEEPRRFLSDVRLRGVFEFGDELEEVSSQSRERVRRVPRRQSSDESNGDESHVRRFVVQRDEERAKRLRLTEVRVRDGRGTTEGCQHRASHVRVQVGDGGGEQTRHDVRLRAGGPRRPGDHRRRRRVVSAAETAVNAPLLTPTRRAIAPDVEQATTRQSRLATRRRVVVV